MSHLPISQFDPVNPAEQLQEYLLMPSMHDAPLEQLWLTQSSKSTEKFRRKRANVMIGVGS